MSSSQKKVLIITYYWPPAGGPGVQRWLKFSKYLPDFGWTPVIYCPENPSYPLTDDSLLKEVPEDLEIVRTRIWEPYQLAEKLNKSNKKFKAGQFDIGSHQSWKSRLSIWIRGNFFIPDARVFWVKPSVKFLRKYLKEHQIDTLVTTGPPHSLHLIGLKLKQENPGLKWIADFRDPWTEISYYKHLKLTHAADQKHHELEAAVFRNADLTLATSFSDAENFSNKGARALCITNGFDTEVSAESTNQTKPGKFTISYVGVLEQLRNPQVLWDVLKELVETKPEFKENFQLKFAGRIDDKILQNLQQSVLESCISNLGYLSHREALEEMRKSSLLLITNFPEEKSRGIIPGKIFEYLATGRRIMSFGPGEADVQRILSETNAGKHFGYTDNAEVREFILQEFQKFLNHHSPEGTENISRYSRKELTKTLAEHLSEL